MSADASGGPGVQRLDKWLWFTRVVKSRTLAAGLIADGRVRVNRERTTKPSASVRAGDVVTVAIRARVMVLKVLAPGERRGPPVEARQLFEDLSPPAAKPDTGGAGPRASGSGRPTKRDRRAIDRLMQGED